MKWLLKMLQKPVARPAKAARPATAQAVKPAEDSHGLRAALAVATDAAERARIGSRLGQSLAGQRQAPCADDPAEVWIAAICHAPDKTLALAWLASLNGDAALGEAATQARSSEVRFAAAQRIENAEMLEQIAEASRDKDKRVYRHCADLLRQRRHVETCARRATAIADELKGLLDSAPLPLSRVLELKHELASLEHAGEPYLVCSALMTQVHDRLHHESEQRRHLQTSQSAAMALESACAQDAWPWADHLDVWCTRHETLSRALAELPPWLAEQAAARTLSASLVKIETRLAELAADDERTSACEQFLAGLEAGTPPGTDLAATWKALPKPRHLAALQALTSRWQALPQAVAPPVTAVVQVPATPPRQPLRVDHDVIRDLLEILEAAIAQGHLADADAVAKQIKSKLAGNNLHGALETRLHDGQAQLEALRGWARWGTGQAREQLIGAAQALLDGEHDVKALATAIRELREAWKRLNVHAPASQALWETFDTTLEKAYAPVLAHRAAEAARQAEARTAREALCATWAAEVAGIAWENADFKAIESHRAEMLKQWHAAPQAGFRHERALRKLFDPLIHGIDQHLEAARGAEFERREQLITLAEALNGQADLGQAMSQAKALQTRWNQEAIPVRLKRSDEQQLWQRFRNACNAIFERRDSQRAEQAAQRQEQAQSRQKRLDEFAATLAGADAHGIKHALAQFRADWGNARPAMRETPDKLESRAAELQQQAQQRLDELRNAKHRERFELLARKAILAERVEAAALAAEPLDSIFAETRLAWDSLPPLPGKAEALLAQRLANAGRVNRAHLDTGHETRKSLLLDLEMALDLPSPDAYATLRRERQLARLRNRFSAPTENRAEPGDLLTQWYATPALPDTSMEARIASVVRHLVIQGSGA